MTDKKNDDLETVRVITEALKSFTKEEREQIIRWSLERLGMQAFKIQSANVMPQESPLMTSPQPFLNSSPKNIKSFVQEKNPKSDVQFAAVAAYFYRFEASDGEKKEKISAKDLQDAGRQARGFGFKDALKTLNNCVRLGYFNRAGRGEFELNAVGENLVAMVLPGGMNESVTSRKINTKMKPKITKKSKK
ncbi:MAG: hypothetical protein RL094_348 [Candidatus Parcubacteria bacterium]|jgi:hypothetical protein